MTAAVALVMAGGRGERLARSLAPAHATGAPLSKPLVPVRGVPLLERCLLAVLQAGVRSVVVATAADAPDVGRFVATRGRALASALGATITAWEEPRPLGTAGAAAGLRGKAQTVLLVNADNLTALRLGELLAEHERLRPAMTVATHVQPFPVPFGQTTSARGLLTEYLEKPTLELTIASGAHVLGAEALEAVAEGRAVGVPEVVETLLARGHAVRAFAHAAPWVDVNDAASLDLAEALVAARPELFERWPKAPDVEVVGAVLRGPSGVLVEWRPATAAAYPGQWDTPGGKIELGETPAAALARELREELGLSLPGARLAAVFDDLDTASGKVFRHHVFAADAGGQRPLARLGQELRWMPLAGPQALAPVNPAVHRALAAAAGRR